MSFSERKREAFALGEAGNYQAAYLAFLEAAEGASKVGERGEQMLLLYNSLIVGGKAGISRRRRLKLMLKVREMTDQHADEVPKDLNRDFAGAVGESFFYFLLVYRPQLSELRRSLSMNKKLHGSDRALCESHVAEAQGLVVEALELAEKAIALFEEGRSSEHRPSLLLAAFDSTLALATRPGVRCSRPQPAQPAPEFARARELLDATWQYLRATPCGNCEKRTWRAELCWQLATGRTLESLRRCVTGLLDHVAHLDAMPETEYIVLSVWLLDSGLGDPGGAAHPSRAGLSRRSPSEQGPTAIYERAMAVLRYRLACLRHAAGFPPSDDVFYQKPQQQRHGLPQDAAAEFCRRLRKARTAVRWAMRCAGILDVLLECDYRQRTVRAYGDRIEAIASAVG